MQESPRLLIVDDDPHKRFLIVHYLRQTLPEAGLAECSSGAEAIEHLKQQPVDAMVTDYNMMPVNGVELINWVRERWAELPILMLTGHPDIEKEALEAGANRVMSSAQFKQVGSVVDALMHARFASV